MAGTGQGVDHDSHAVLFPVVNGVIVERLQHFTLQTDAASGGVLVRRSAMSKDQACQLKFRLRELTESFRIFR